MSTFPAAQPVRRTVTGFTPSGPLHLGALLAVVEPMRELARTTDALVFVSDLHALTLHHDPRELAARRDEVAALLIACGLDDATLFLQSDVPEVTTLHYLLEATATYGEASRMVQFKEKSVQQGDRGVRLALLSYPVLMAADILAYGITHVPVGEDQVQHLELTRTLARRANAAYGEHLVVPEAVVVEPIARVLDLADPTRKMSKSNPVQRGVLRLLDPPDVLRRKVSKAVTGGEDDPGVANLRSLLTHLGGTPGASYADLKRDLADAVIARLEPIQRRYAELRRGRSGVEHRYAEGARRARDLAAPTVRALQQGMGVRGGQEDAGQRGKYARVG